MSSDNQAEFNGWAKVEILGRQSHTGMVRTEAYGQAVMFRIDRPEIPEREETLKHPDWVGDTRCPAGSIVRRAKIEAVTVLVGSGSIYRIIPCTEEVALKAIVEASERPPLQLVRLPESAQIAEAAPLRERDPDDDDDEDDSDPPIVSMTPEEMYNTYREHFLHLELLPWSTLSATDRKCWTDYLYSLKAE
jgi:hypothetical protein